MNSNPILIVWGEPNSVFSEIFIKSIQIYKSKKPIILIGSLELFIKQLKKLKIKYNKSSINLINDNLKNLKKDKINLLNIKQRHLTAETSSYVCLYSMC